MEYELILGEVRKQLSKERGLKNRILLERVREDLTNYQRAKEDELLAQQLAKQAKK